ncbi:phage tail protein, partial [Lactiplantibacillus plantarum]|nr:phage tail protein [Lactiplantibacillus plantarum]
MAESNATQVILTDDGIKIIKAQNTADNAAGGVANLNDPNLMSVIEKQTQASQYAGLTSQYNVILKRAKDANISTTALTTAYTNLNTFMATILTDTTKASDVDRDTYKALTGAYNTALSNVQTALSNSFNTDISNMQSSVSVASQAASSAVIVASQAAVTGNNASQSASQAVVVASQAKSAGDNANSVANSASQAASNAILAGSQASVSASQASADYQKLSAGVNDGSIVHITTETVIDKGVIGTAEIANAAITNAQIGKEAVGMAQIANLAVGTAQIG